MNRRAFVKALLGTAAAAAILPSLDLLPDAPAAIAPPTTLPTIPAWVNDAAAFNVGDVFTIEGVYEFNPLTRRPIVGRLKPFVITATVQSEEGVTIYPRLIPDGQYQNSSNMPSADAHIRPYLTGRTR